MDIPHPRGRNRQGTPAAALAAILLLAIFSPVVDGEEGSEGSRAAGQPHGVSIIEAAVGAWPPGPAERGGTDGGRLGRRAPLLNACAGKTKPDYWIGKLKDGDPKTRSTAARALGEMREEAAVSALIQALKDTDPRVRLSVVQALGRIGPRAQAAVPALKAMQTDGDPRVREELTRSLEKITQQRQNQTGR